MDHQTIVKNVGYGVYATLPGKVSLIDSWVWSNARFAITDCTQLKEADALTLKNVSATYCAFDNGANIPGQGNFSTLTYNKNDENYPVCENPTRNIGYTLDAFNTYNGGLTSYMPSNMNPIINRRLWRCRPYYYRYYHRYSPHDGGGPDIGAYQNSKLPLKGRVFYVRDYRYANGKVDLSRGGDGSSWANAINGNAIYDLSASPEEAMIADSTGSSKYVGYFDATTRPYGETSNASKPFWGDIEIGDVSYKKTGDDTAFGTGWYYYSYTGVCSWDGGANGYENTENNSCQVTGSIRIWGTGGAPTDRRIRNAIEDDISQPYRITNTREEQYVGGLQYAVEMASRAACDSMRRLEVWVAGGTYTDYKGFVIRDSVTVKGGFPDADTGSPGESERRPLLAKGIPLNDENSDYADRIADYETILQIQVDSPVTVTDAVNGRYTVSAGLPSNIRKYVLFQPDVCLPTKAPLDGTYSHGNTGTSSGASDQRRDDYLKYNGASWDGFTIRHGFINGLAANRDGGAGVRLFQGASLKNCVVRNNYNNASSADKKRNRGGGIYCDSPDGTVENCFVYNNVTRSDEAYGGGMYMILGTGYNLLVSRNYAQTHGGGIFIEDATFFNNTVAYNGSGDKGTGGMHQYTGNYNTDVTLNVFNTLIYGNSGVAVGAEKAEKLNPFRNCYVQTREQLHQDIASKITPANGNKQGTDLPNPFERGESAAAENDYRLSGSSACVNAGLNEPAGIALPSTDVDFADRIQDCTVDIGAYEYNGAYGITPSKETVNIGGVATEAYVYYVSYSGADGGNASADSPENAACWMKLQKVLDAAGRTKYSYPTTPCIVKVAGSSMPYAPRRTTVVPDINQIIESDVDVRSYALIVPRGVEVWGGYKELSASGEYKGGFAEADRSIIGNKTTFKAEYVSAADTSLINTYHAVVFTEYLYDENGDLIMLDDDHYKTIPEDAGRAVLDGLFITGGNADGSLQEYDNKGGGVVAEPYTHIRNCIVRGNTASGEGGGIYQKAGAIVSGTLVTGNSADMGGGIYVDGTDHGDRSYIVASTVAQNSSSGEGGGIYFTGRQLVVNSSVVWGNTANYAKDLYGNYGSDENGNYLFSYVAVENLQVPGLNNRSVSADNNSGVRFVSEADGSYGYYMISQTSVLVAAGMPSTEYLQWEKQLSTHDFAGLVRSMGDNIDVGARSLGFSIAPPPDVLMQRIFVTDGTLVHPDLGTLLSADLSDEQKIYQIRGASFVYPMYELHDALRYIKHIRSKEGSLVPGVNNKDLLFEIYMAGGTYVPRVASDGTTVENARTSTFTVPEGVSIYGGFSGKELYCQHDDTYGGTHEVAGIEFESGTSETFLAERERHGLERKLHRRAVGVFPPDCFFGKIKQ